MTRRTITTLMLGAAALSTIAYAEQPAKTYYSKDQRMGNGTIRTYVTLSPEGDEKQGGARVPTAIGIEFPASALQNLPAPGTENEPWIIYLPPQARQTPFQYAMVDWNPLGHPGPMYQLPHFDFHFYTQDLDEVMNIKPGPCSGLDCSDFATAMKPVPPQFMPAGYTNVGAVEPYMGNHLVDLSSPEFNGQIFTRTFIYGAYDGKITFQEAMITRDFLLSKPAECKPYGLPQAYAETGYYPTKYCTVYNPQNDTYRISLEGLTYRVAPGDRRHD